MLLLVLPGWLRFVPSLLPVMGLWYLFLVGPTGTMRKIELEVTQIYVLCTELFSPGASRSISLKVVVVVVVVLGESRGEVAGTA